MSGSRGRGFGQGWFTREFSFYLSHDLDVWYGTEWTDQLRRVR